MVKAPKFLQCLYDILQYEDHAILHWCHDGTYFQVRDVPRLEREVLPKYFKHGRFASFQRQLNNFGFHKWTKTRANVCTFSHDVLVQCHPNHLCAMLTAAAYTSGKAAAPAPPKAEVAPMLGLKRQRSDGAATARAYYSAAAAMTPSMVAAAAIDAKTRIKRICIDMNAAMGTSAGIDVVGADTDYVLHDADLDCILDSLVGSTGSSSPLLLLDAVDVSDLLVLDWPQVTTSSACHLGGSCSVCGASESDCECDSRAIATAADDAASSVDTTACDDDLLLLLPDSFPFACADSGNGDEYHNVETTVALACLAPDALGSELLDSDDALFITLDGEVVQMYDDEQRQDQSQKLAMHIVSL